MTKHHDHPLADPAAALLAALLFLVAAPVLADPGAPPSSPSGGPPVVVVEAAGWLDLTPGQLWKALATHDGLRLWGGAEAAIDLRPRGRLVVALAMGEGAAPHRAEHAVVAYEPERLLIVTPSLGGGGRIDPAHPSWTIVEWSTGPDWSINQADRAKAAAAGARTHVRVQSHGRLAPDASPPAAPPTPGGAGLLDALGRLGTNPAALDAIAAPPPPRDLLHVIDLPATRAEAWHIFGTAEGWRSFAVPRAAMDDFVGGLIRTRYDAGGELGDPGTIIQHILARDEPRLLAIRAEPVPEIPLSRFGETTWSIIRIEAVDETTTRLSLRGMGYGDDAESEQVREFFRVANQQLLERLRDQLADRRAAAAARAAERDRIAAFYAHVASDGGEWRYEGPAGGGRPGALFRVRSIYRLGPSGHGVVSRGWLGNERGMIEHGAFLAWVEPGGGDWQYVNVDERGQVARGAIRSPEDGTIVYDWVVHRHDGGTTPFDVRVALLPDDPDAYRLAITRMDQATGGGEPPRPMVDLIVRRVDPSTAPDWPDLEK